MRSSPEQSPAISSEARVGVGRLAERYMLPEHAARALEALVGLLAHDASAPTSLRGERATLNDHLADSLVALELEEVRRARAIADIGSGAGLPGLPLAAALPEATVWLIESNGRKCAFLEGAHTRCGLENAQIVNLRAELWHAGLGRCELVTARALAALPVVAEYAAPLLAIGGTVAVWRGARDAPDEAAAARAADELGLEPRPPLAVRPYPTARDRYLHLMSKVRPTPERFPRRPGVAAKRPLGSRPES